MWLWINEIKPKNHLKYGAWLWTLHTKVMDIADTLLHLSLSTYRLTSHKDCRPHGFIHMWLWIYKICPHNHLKFGPWLWTLHIRVIDILGTHLHWSLPAYRPACHQYSKTHGCIHMWLWIHKICPQNHLNLGLWLWILHTRVIYILGTHLHWSMLSYRPACHQHSRSHGSIHMWLWTHEICPQNHLKLGLWLWTLHTRVIEILSTHLHWSLPASRSINHQHWLWCAGSIASSHKPNFRWFWEHISCVHSHMCRVHSHEHHVRWFLRHSSCNQSHMWIELCGLLCWWLIDLYAGRLLVQRGAQNIKTLVCRVHSHEPNLRWIWGNISCIHSHMCIELCATLCWWHAGLYDSILQCKWVPKI